MWVAFLNAQVEKDFTSETIVHEGLTYKTIKSQISNKIWLDRNLGAQRVCINKGDEKCRGAYFDVKSITNNTCPKNFRLPTMYEYSAEKSRNLRDINTAVKSFLKMAPAGVEGKKHNDKRAYGYEARLLTSTPANNRGDKVIFTFHNFGLEVKASDSYFSYSVRCINN